MEENFSAHSDQGTIIFETLKKELLDLTIKPGEEIHETLVCKRFSVTRPPVRTALKRLSDIGLVDIRPYYGIYATLLNIDQIYEIVHMRILVESSVIRDYINSRPDGFEIEKLEHNLRLEKILASEKNVDHNKFYELDNELHKIWFTGGHCLSVWNIIEDQKIQYQRFRMLDFTATKNYAKTLEDHTRIVEAIKSRNRKVVPNLIGMHLNNGLERVSPKVLTDFKQYVVPPQNMDYWRKYNLKYYK